MPVGHRKLRQRAFQPGSPNEPTTSPVANLNIKIFRNSRDETKTFSQRMATPCASGTLVTHFGVNWPFSKAKPVALLPSKLAVVSHDSSADIAIFSGDVRPSPTIFRSNDTVFVPMRPTRMLLAR